MILLMNCVVRLFIGISLFAILVPLAAAAGSDALFESQQLERWVNFEALQKSRSESRVRDEAAVDVIRQRRRDRLEEQELQRARHVATMKRYSMEEAERLEAENQRISDDEDQLREQGRKVYLNRRDMFLEIERRIGRIDANLEYDIDMEKEPDSKTSWSDFKSTATGEGRESN